LGLYGTTEDTRPHDITFGGVSILGSSLGGGINLQAGYNIYITVDNIGGRTGQVITGNRNDNRFVTTADVGSTASAVVLTGGSSTTNKYVGGTLVTTIQGKFTASMNAGTQLLNVSAMDGVTPGRIVVGAQILGNGMKAQQRIVSQVSGTPG